MGRVLEDLGERQAAIESYRRAASCQPNLTPAWHHLGVALVDGTAIQEAIDAMGRARFLTRMIPRFR